jgi:hypothetical protein
MNEVKKPRASEGDGVHSREPQLFIVDTLAAGVHAMSAGQLGATDKTYVSSRLS